MACRWHGGAVGILLLLLLLLLRAADAAGCSYSHGTPAVQAEYARRFNLARAVRAAKEAEKDNPWPLAELRKLLAASTPGPLRILPVYQLDDGPELQLPQDFKDLVRSRLIPGTLRVLQKYLKLRIPSTEPVRLDRAEMRGNHHCSDAVLDSRIFGEGYNNTDLVAYVTAVDCSDNVLAYTSVCVWEDVTSRPQVASINVCPALVQYLSEADQVSTLVHEVLHALAFNEYSQEWWYDWRTGLQYDTQPLVVTGDNGISYLRSPKVTEVARRHFGCPTLPGAPVDHEDAGSHFSQRALDHEVMIPVTTNDGYLVKFTEFTLAALEDSGIWVPDYSKAEPYSWGRGQGCAFVADTCDDFLEQQRSDGNYSSYFCTQEMARQRADFITYDYQGIGTCYPGTRYDGGPCFTATRPLWMCSNETTFRKAHSARDAMRRWGGTIGTPTSRAVPIDSALRSGSDKFNISTAICFDTRCSAGGVLSLVFKFGDKDFTFPCLTGTTLDLAEAMPNHYDAGVVHCPDNRLVCETQACGTSSSTPCGVGWCASGGQCVCRMDYTGLGCKTNLVPEK